ncbi:hypothetical protein RAS1_29710 [Phycisphaerae bacterium RAS1]|nr:hypothetical protein RAS1_29710 [Phycisphaerae bacterium RAS1]
MNIGDERSAAVREQENALREQHLHLTRDYSERYCECIACHGRKSISIAWFNKALDRLAAQFGDGAEQYLDSAGIYGYVDAAFAQHAIAEGWRVYDGALYCPKCILPWLR